MAKIKLGKEAKTILNILGKEYKENSSSRTEGVLMKSLLARAGIYNPKDITNFTNLSIELQTHGLATTIVNEIPVARGTAQETRMLLTVKGWNYLNPWHKKMWGWFKGDVRAIIVSAITALVVYWLLKLFAE